MKTLAIVLFGILFLLPGMAGAANVKADILAGLEEYGAKVKDLETRFQELKKSGALYEPPEGGNRIHGTQWDVLLQEAERAVIHANGYFDRATRTGDASFDDPKVKAMLAEFEAYKERLRKSIDWFSPLQYAEKPIPELTDLLDAVRNMRRAYVNAKAGVSPEETQESVRVAFYYFDQMLEKNKAGGPDATPDLEKHPHFIAAKERMTFYQKEIDSLSAPSTSK
ncbi:MAG TPA: hypothetical protein PKO06_21645 [Candidatus Ozemobacteraceae bacterium]|nr:hypothetical protein [Candidatus Ozemobacteraceae bacterium]